MADGGNPFQTFYLMFKSNAKDAEKDMKNLQKTSDETTKSIKKSKEESVELGKSFTDAVETGARALAAYVSFSAIKSGLVDAERFNRTLTTQADLWGKNANEIAAWGAAAKAAGGSEQGFIGWYQGILQGNAAVGRNTLAPGQLLDHIRNQVKGLSPEAAQRIFGLYGLSDPGIQKRLRGSDEDYSKFSADAAELTNNMKASGAATQEFGQSWDRLETALRKFWLTVETVILPPLAHLIDGFTKFFNMIANDKESSVAFFVAMTAATTVLSAALGGLALGFLRVGSAALSAIPAVAAFFAPFLALGIGVAAGYIGGKAIGNWAINKGGNNAAGRIDSSSAMNYLTSKYGLSSAQAAGIVANMQAESGGRAGAIGDGGSARGLFQWHPDRQAKILAGTGIDVTKANWTQQLDAAVWELKTRPEYAAFSAAKTPFDAASIFSQRFEAPAGGLAEAMSRGQSAMQIAGSTPFASQGSLGGNSSNVNVGQITVHTQATDAPGVAAAIGSELQRHITNIFSQNADAVQY